MNTNVKKKKYPKPENACYEYKYNGKRSRSKGIQLLILFDSVESFYLHKSYTIIVGKIITWKISYSIRYFENSLWIIKSNLKILTRFQLQLTLPQMTKFWNDQNESICRQ